MKDIKIRILKTEDVDWRNLKILQTAKLKEMDQISYSKLKVSMKKNNFIQTLNVWDDNGTIYILDGTHRKKILQDLLKEGMEIPNKLPANFIDCKDRKEAAKFILIFSSLYAKIQTRNFGQFIKNAGLDIGEIGLEIDIPNLRLSDTVDIGFDYYGLDDELADSMVDTDNNMDISKGDICMFNDKHFIVNGEIHQLGYRINNAFSSIIDFDFIKEFNQNKMNEMMIGKTIYAIGVEKYLDKILKYKEGSNLIWSNLKEGKANLTKDNGFRLLWRYPRTKKVIWYVKGTSNKLYKNEIKPVKLYRKMLIDSIKEDEVMLVPYCGDGGVLIAAEQTNRIIYGAEEDTNLFRYTIERYRKNFPQNKIEIIKGDN